MTQRSLAELERIADEKAREFDEIYLKVPRRKRKKAYRIFLEVATGKITYEEGLERLRRLAKG